MGPFGSWGNFHERGPRLLSAHVFTHDIRGTFDDSMGPDGGYSWISGPVRMLGVAGPVAWMVTPARMDGN